MSSIHGLCTEIQTLLNNDTVDEQRSEEILNELEKIPMTVNLLHETRIGKILNKLRKQLNSKLKKRAKKLIRSWKHVVKLEVDQNTEAQGQVEKNISNGISHEIPHQNGNSGQKENLTEFHRNGDEFHGNGDKCHRNGDKFHRNGDGSFEEQRINCDESSRKQHDTQLPSDFNGTRRTKSTNHFKQNQGFNTSGQSNNGSQKTEQKTVLPSPHKKIKAPSSSTSRILSPLSQDKKTKNNQKTKMRKNVPDSPKRSDATKKRRTLPQQNKSSSLRELCSSNSSAKLPSLRELCIAAYAQQVGSMTDYSKLPKKTAKLIIIAGKPNVAQLREIERVNPQLGPNAFEDLWKKMSSKLLGASLKPPNKTWKEHFTILSKARELQMAKFCKKAKERRSQAKHQRRKSGVQRMDFDLAKELTDGRAKKKTVIVSGSCVTSVEDPFNGVRSSRRTSFGHQRNGAWGNSRNGSSRNGSSRNMSSRNSNSRKKLLSKMMARRSW